MLPGNIHPAQGEILYHVNILNHFNGSVSFGMKWSNLKECDRNSHTPFI